MALRNNNAAVAGKFSNIQTVFLEGLLLHLISTSLPPYSRFAGEAHEETFRLQGRAEQQVTDRDLGIYGGVRSPGRGMAL